MSAIQIDAGDEVITVLAESGVEGGPPIPCHRCGVCCERWQPLLTPADAARLAAHLGLTLADFHAAYTTPYPFDDERRLLRQEDGHCVFLRYEPIRERDERCRSGCAAHAERPAICREWQAGLDKKECVQGLLRFADDGGRVRVADLYAEADERAGFLAALPLLDAATG